MGRRNPRRTVHWAAYLWPGLPHLWIAGSWAGLILALSFTLLFNLLLLTTFVWTEWLPWRVQLGCAAILGAIWIAALVETRLELGRIAARRAQLPDGAADGTSAATQLDEVANRHADSMLREAQAAYLAGNWIEAERTLQELVRLDRRDMEGQLLLATLWRHNGRLDDAKCQLDRLERLEDAATWEFEIGRERALIGRLRAETGAGDPFSSPGEATPVAA